MLVSLVLIVSLQYRKVLNTDPGYEYKNLVYETFPSYDQTKMNAIAGALRSLPEVEAAELTYTLPFEKASGNNVYLPGDDRELFNIADEYGASEGFFDMMGFRLVEGSVPKGPNDVAVYIFTSVSEYDFTSASLSGATSLMVFSTLRIAAGVTSFSLMTMVCISPDQSYLSTSLSASV